ncbi:Zinc finger, SWIM-type [Phytophthora cactorum]|nr:Zinc finger, SWIM-type [Phytophthora cactorum]
MVVETLADKKTNASNRTRDKHTITPRAKPMFDRQVWNTAICSVGKSTDSVFYVDDFEPTIEEADPGKTNEVRRYLRARWPRDQITFTVDLASGSCTRCADSEHLQLPCRHIIAALYHQSGSHTSNAGAHKFFHRAFTAEAYAQVYVGASISLPFVPTLLTDPNIQAPPIYNQAGGSHSRV